MQFHSPRSFPWRRHTSVPTTTVWLNTVSARTRMVAVAPYLLFEVKTQTFFNENIFFIKLCV